MKILVLIRHSKSSWDEDVNDLKRPLSERGFTDANLVFTAFKSQNFHPDAIYSSPATRAKASSTIFMKTLNLPERLLTYEEQLYDFGGNQVLRFIKSLDDQINKVVIFGHNHAFTSLANSLGDTYIDNLPTSGLVMIEFQVDKWQDVIQGTTKLVLTPKDFK